MTPRGWTFQFVAIEHMVYVSGLGLIILMGLSPLSVSLGVAWTGRFAWRLWRATD